MYKRISTLRIYTVFTFLSYISIKHCPQYPQIALSLILSGFVFADCGQFAAFYIVHTIVRTNPQNSYFYCLVYFYSFVYNYTFNQSEQTMPAKQILSPSLNCDANILESLLAVLAMRGFLSRNQVKTIATACAHYLPCDVEISQRMPKGTTYISINAAPMYEINNRAKITFVGENT